MSWDVNRYYQVPQGGEEAKKLVESLLQSYPLTKVAFEILGSSLIDQSSFAYIGEGKDIITQGEKGKDLYLVCLNPVQVLVDGGVVVTMDSPVLLGDKALIWPDSTRAATIRVPAKMRALVIKIPMGLFLRDFTYAEISDTSFKREKDIYLGLFQEIQARLFSYVPEQKNLFESINSTILGLNRKFIAQLLEKGEELFWPEDAWVSLQNFLQSKFEFYPPKGEKLTVANFKPLLQAHFNTRYRLGSLPGNEAEKVAKRQMLWNSWIAQAATHLVGSLPQKNLSFSLKDIQLFNPLNYQASMKTLMERVENFFPPRAKAVQKGDISDYLKSGEQSGEVDLHAYQAYLCKHYYLKYPQRVIAMLAQSCARIAAECENGFNKALAKIRQYDESTQHYKSTVQEATTKELEPKVVQAHLNQLLRGFNKLAQNRVGVGEVPLGETHYVPALSGKLPEVAATGSTKHVQESISVAYRELLEHLGLVQEPLGLGPLIERVQLMSGLPGNRVPASELTKNYFIPLGKGIQLKCNDVFIENAQPGGFYGGEGWLPVEEGADQPYLNLPERKKDGLVDQGHLFLVIPNLDLSKTHINEEKFDTETLPWWVWLKDRMIRELLTLTKNRDQLLERCLSLEEALSLDEKVAGLEENENPLGENEAEQIKALLTQLADFTWEEPGLSSKEVTRRLYEHLVIQAKTENPEHSDDQIQNHCYTRFRFFLSEMVRLLNQPDKSEEEKVDQVDYSPVATVLHHRLARLLEEEEIEQAKQWVQTDGSSLEIDLKEILATQKTLEKKKKIFRLIQGNLEQEVLKLRRQRRRLEERFVIVASGQQGEKAKELQKKFIQEQVEKLDKLLSKGLQSELSSGEERQDIEAASADTPESVATEGEEELELSLDDLGKGGLDDDDLEGDLGEGGLDEDDLEGDLGEGGLDEDDLEGDLGEGGLDDAALEEGLAE